MGLLFLLLILMVLAALWAVMTSLLLRSALALALTSIILSMIMFELKAPYAAVFELSVCAGLIPVVFISVISLAHRLPLKEYLRRRESRIFRFWYLPLVMIAAFFLIRYFKFPVTLDLPWPEAVRDVRTVLWENKRLDLFGQILALLAGAYGVIILFVRREEDDRK